MFLFPSSFFFFCLIDYFHWNLNVKKIQGCCTDDSWRGNKRQGIAKNKTFSIPLLEGPQWNFSVSEITFPKNSGRRKQRVSSLLQLPWWEHAQRSQLQSCCCCFALAEDKCWFAPGAAQQDSWRMCSSGHRAIIWIPINPKSAGSLKRFCYTICFSHWRILYFERKENSFMQMHNQFSHWWSGIRQNTGHQKLCLKFQIILCFQYQVSFDKGGSFDELLNSASFMKKKEYYHLLQTYSSLMLAQAQLWRCW